MPSLADSPELVGFFSYSRDDDADSNGALSALRDRIQRELRGQLGRSARDFRIWQDKEAIPPGRLWEDEIRAALGQSVFFIPIITPTTLRSPYCRVEFDAFLARERALGRDDLIFPILYIRVPALEDRGQREADPVLAMIARRQYVDWRQLRHLDVRSGRVGEAVEYLCSNIADALRRPHGTPVDFHPGPEASAERKRDAYDQRSEKIPPTVREQPRREAPDAAAAVAASDDTPMEPTIRNFASASPERSNSSEELSLAASLTYGAALGFVVMAAIALIVAAIFSSREFHSFHFREFDFKDYSIIFLVYGIVGGVFGLGYGILQRHLPRSKTNHIATSAICAGIASVVLVLAISVSKSDYPAANFLLLLFLGGAIWGALVAAMFRRIGKFRRIWKAHRLRNTALPHR